MSFVTFILLLLITSIIRVYKDFSYSSSGVYNSNSTINSFRGLKDAIFFYIFKVSLTLFRSFISENLPTTLMVLINNKYSFIFFILSCFKLLFHCFNSLFFLCSLFFSICLRLEKIKNLPVEFLKILEL